ncbi:MAG: protein kinase domain-containing protein [Candidatus Sericytochromatia bacterium]
MSKDEDALEAGLIVLTKYRLIKEIGRGGMGVIYLAEDIRLGREVALKELVISRTIQGKERDDIISRFQREARTTATLNHPNIVTIFDIGEDQNRHFIAMEYLPGQTLKDAIESNHDYTLEDILDIFVQVASALDHAHNRGVIHRDIKPDNVKILQDNVVKLMDFGIAGLESRNSNLTQDGTILGTIAYISPEQLYNSKNVTSRADQFSYGVMMYEMFTRKLPFDGETVGATIMQIMSEHPRPPQQVNPRLPERIAQVIMRCLEKTPQQRFDNMRELIQELVAYQISLSNRELREPVIGAELSYKREPHSTRQAPFRMTALSSGHLTLNKYKLLQIEDDLSRLQIMRTYIENAGLPFECVQATSVAEATKHLTGERFDFVICDYQLADGSAEPILELAVDTSVIVVSATDKPQVIIDLMKRGAVDYILKSNAVEELHQIVGVIEEKTANQQLKAWLEKFNSQLPEEKQRQSAVIKQASSQTVPQTLPEHIQFQHVIGKQGSQPGEFASPRWITYCPHEKALFVADTQNSRVQILSPDGQVKRIVSHPELKAPCAVTTDSAGRLFVLDAGDARLLIFDSSGTLLHSSGGNPPFRSVFGIALLEQQHLLVTDPDASALHLLHLNGELKETLSGEFKKPSGITVAQNKVYLLDHGLPAVLTLNEAGEITQRFGKRGTAKGDFSVPKGIAVDHGGLIYVAEALSHRVQVLNQEGVWQTGFGKKGSAAGEFTNPESLTTTPEGQLFVLDRGNHRIQVFTYAEQAVLLS